MDAALDHYRQKLEDALLCKHDLSDLSREKKMYALDTDQKWLAEHDNLRSKVSSLWETFEAMVKEDTKFQLDNIADEDSHKSISTLLAENKPLVLLRSESVSFQNYSSAGVCKLGILLFHFNFLISLCILQLTRLEGPRIRKPSLLAKADLYPLFNEKASQKMNVGSDVVPLQATEPYNSVQNDN